MRTVKNKSELISALKEGERDFILDGKLLILQCKIASLFNNKKDVSRAAVTAAVSPAANECGIAASTLIVLFAIAVSGAIAIIAVVKGMGVDIEVEHPSGYKAKMRVKDKA